MAKILKICGREVGLGEQARVDLQVAKLPSNTIIDIPLHVFRGKEDGPVLLLIAGLHGDEVNGIEIIRRLILDKSVSPQRGTILTIPILNVYGFINFSRQVSDGKDINRSFPGNSQGSLASRVAALFMKEIFPHFDYGIDFHTGGGLRSNYPQVRCVLGNKTNSGLAHAFSPPIILNSSLRDKSLRREAERKKKSIIVYEGGESLRFDEFVVKEGIKGAKRVMKHLNMIDVAPAPEQSPIVLSHSTWVRARHSGLFHPRIKLGEEVKKNQLLGTLSDPYGQLELKVKASRDGVIVGLNNAAVVSQGDALYHIGYR